MRSLINKYNRENDNRWLVIISYTKLKQLFWLIIMEHDISNNFPQFKSEGISDNKFSLEDNKTLSKYLQHERL